MKKYLIVLIFLGMSLTSFGQDATTTPEFDPTFVHSVYVWLNNPDSKADREAFEKAMHTFLNNSKYAKTKFFGTPPKATREVVDDSFTYKMIVTFESAEAQDAYQQEEAHLKFIEEAQPLWKKVVVYDAVSIDN